MNWHNTLKIAILFPLLVIATGCLEHKDYLVLNKDGSGTYRCQVIPGAQLKAMMAQAEQSGTQGNVEVSGGPMAFKREDLMNRLKGVEGVKLAEYSHTQDRRGRDVYEFALEFDSIAELLRSPLGEDIGWCFKKENGNLVAYLPQEWTEAENDNSASQQMDLSDPEAFNMIKPMLTGLKVDRRIRLPNPVLESNRTRQRNNILSWVFQVTPETTQKELTDPVVPRAVCSVEGITFDLPVKPSETADGGKQKTTEDVPAISEEQAAGMINGEDVVIRNAEIRNGILTFYENTDPFDGASMNVLLFLGEGQSLEGKEFTVPREDKGTTPHVHVHYSVGDQRKTETFMHDYQMKLQFGKMNEEDKLPGRIQLKVPSKQKTHLSGVFTAKTK